MALNLNTFNIPCFHSLNRDSHRQHPQRTYRCTHVNRKISCSVSTQVSDTAADERRSAQYFEPTLWTYNFVQSLKNINADETYKDKATKLEEEVRGMISNETGDLLTILELIDDIKRLGLAYRFQKDIEKALGRFQSLGGCNALKDKSLYAIALSFRLLREQGYNVSQDIFKDFLDEKGDIVASLKRDIKGVLSFYEASFLALEGEDFLDKASVETRKLLISLENSPDCVIADSINHVLELPLHRRMVMLQARYYIEVYSKRKDAKPALLELAKLNFNMLQSVLQRDLKDVSRWWNSLGLATKLSFSRDRLMESFFWSVGMAYEPQYGSCRKGVTKVFQLVTTIDDVYDVYGTLEELEPLTEAIERWDVSAVRNLPYYMKLCYLALYNTINEIAYEILKKQGEDVLPYLTKAWADLCKAFLQEAKWNHNKITPSFDDYLENAWRSVSGAVMLTHSYFELGQGVSKQGLDGLENYHELLKWPSIIFRLCNDLSTSSAELARGETANSITCYMKEAGVSEDEARQHINKLIDRAWKKMNGDQIDKSPFSKAFVETALNLASISECQYQHGDGHGAPDDISKNRVQKLIIEPIPIREYKK